MPKGHPALSEVQKKEIVARVSENETVANPTPQSPLKSPYFSKLFPCY